MEYGNHMFNAGDLNPGARETVRALSKSKIRRTIGSNTGSEILISRLKVAGIYDYFDFDEDEIYASEDVIGCRKSDPEFFNYIKKDNPTIEPKRILFLGDSWKSDIVGAHKAGMSTCYYNPKASPIPEQGICNHEIRNLLEFLNILGIRQDRPEERGRDD